MSIILSDYKDPEFIFGEVNDMYEPCIFLNCPSKEVFDSEYEDGESVFMEEYHGNNFYFDTDINDIDKLCEIWDNCEKDITRMTLDDEVPAGREQINMIINNTAYDCEFAEHDSYNSQYEKIVVPIDEKANKESFWGLLALARKKMAQRGGIFVNLTPCWDILCLTEKLRDELIMDNIFYICIDTRTLKNQAFSAHLSKDGSIITPWIIGTIDQIRSMPFKSNNQSNISYIECELGRITDEFRRRNSEEIVKIPNRLTPNDPRNGNLATITKLDLEPLIVNISDQNIVEDKSNKPTRIIITLNNNNSIDETLDKLWQTMDIYRRNTKAIITTDESRVEAYLKFLSDSNPAKKHLYLLVPEGFNIPETEELITVKTFKDNDDLNRIIKKLR